MSTPTENLSQTDLNALMNGTQQLSWPELSAILQRGEQLRVGGDLPQTFVQRGDRVQALDDQGNELSPRGYANLQGAARARGVTRTDLGGAYAFSMLQDKTYKTPHPITDRERAVNAVTKDIMQSLPKDQRAALNGPVRAYLGAVNRRNLELFREVDTMPTFDTPETRSETAGTVAKALEQDDPAAALKRETEEINAQVKAARMTRHAERGQAPAVER